MNNLGHRAIDLTGKIFGELTVLKLGLKRSKGSLYWVVKCSCGNLKELRSDCLRKREYTHCGCKTAKVKPGDKFGKLVVIKLYETNKKHKIWLCRCDCGNDSFVRTVSLTKDGTKSCGCLNKSFDRKGAAKIVGDIRPWYFNKIKRGAQGRHLKFNITPEDIWSLWLEQNGKCNLSNIKLTLPQECRKRKEYTASLDRIDSSKGYTKENVQWVHKHINIMKWNLSQEEFIQFCKLIAKHNQDC